MKITEGITGAVLYEDNASSVRETVENALTAGIDLRGANLRGADLRGTGLLVVQAGDHVAYVCGTLVRIECQQHDISVWMTASDEHIRAWGGDPAEWALYRPLIEMASAISCEQMAGKEEGRT